MDNLQVIQEMYKNFAEKNMPAVLNCFDKDVVWIRPGEPAIPFSGSFTGMEGLAKMFTIISQTVKINSLAPEKIIAQDDTVAVIGSDKADVIATGKSYTSEWVYVYTLKNEKIIHVQVYIDTLELAKAFQP
jgi:ketosteroid isomerase-like protein